MKKKRVEKVLGSRRSDNTVFHYCKNTISETRALFVKTPHTKNKIRYTKSKTYYISCKVKTTFKTIETLIKINFSIKTLQILHKQILPSPTTHHCAKSKTFLNISTFLMICVKYKNTIAICQFHLQHVGKMNTCSGETKSVHSKNSTEEDKKTNTIKTNKIQYSSIQYCS